MASNVFVEEFIDTNEKSAKVKMKEYLDEEGVTLEQIHSVQYSQRRYTEDGAPDWFKSAILLVWGIEEPVGNTLS